STSRITLSSSTSPPSPPSPRPLSLHAALPIFPPEGNEQAELTISLGTTDYDVDTTEYNVLDIDFAALEKSTSNEALKALDRYFADRKSTRLNSSHVSISYAVFCLKQTKTEDRP